VAIDSAVRQEMNVPTSARPPLLAVETSEAQRQVLEANATLICRLLRVSEVRFVGTTPEGASPYTVNGAALALPVTELIDLEGERARLAREIGGLEAEIQKLSQKLNSTAFIARAPEEVVEESRERLSIADASHARLKVALSRLQNSY
jgi:valyl-tRNA synthetase